MTPTLRYVAACLVLLCVTGCDDSPEPKATPDLTLEDMLLRDATPDTSFQGQLQGKPVHLIVHNCRVYKSEPGQTPGSRQWVKVLELEFYPFGSSCVRNTLGPDGKGVQAYLGRQALGAGGPANNTFRSFDGVTWKRK